MPKWCDQGESDVLNFYLKNPGKNLWIGLYTAPTSEPGENATLSTLTEPSGSNYSRIAFAKNNWTISGTEPTQAEHSQVTFTASGGNWGNVYGYFICDVASGTSGNLIAVEHFSNGPYNVQDGGSIKITARINCT